MAFCFSFNASVNAESKKTVYVLTAEKKRDYNNEFYFTRKYSYNKDGFISSVKYSDSDKWRYKGVFSYNKKRQAKRQKYTHYQHGISQGTFLLKYDYNKRGYLKRARSFWDLEGDDLYRASYFSWNSKGLVTKEHHYWEDDEYSEALEKYRYDNDGKYLGGSGFDSSGDSFYKTCEYPTEDTRTITEYSYNDEADSDEDYWVAQTITKQKINGGRVLSETVYDAGSDEVYERISYSYKKIKVKKKHYAIVTKQQRYISYLMDY